MTNNNITNVNTTTAVDNVFPTSTPKWKTIINKDFILENCITNIIDSIFNLIIFDTCLKHDVDEEMLKIISNSFSKMINTPGVLLIKDQEENIINKFIFSSYRRKWDNKRIQLSLLEILNFISSNKIWFEDTLNNGFYCHINKEKIIFEIEREQTTEDDNK